MKFIYPAVFRKTETEPIMDFSRIWNAAMLTVTPWTMPLTTQMKQLITGSLWSFLRMTVIFHLFLIKRIWSFRREILYGIFL